MKKFSILSLLAFIVCPTNSMVTLFDPDKPLDISYIETYEGAEHLRTVNSQLKKNGLRIHIQNIEGNALVSINVGVPGESGFGYTFVPLFTISRREAKGDNKGEKLLPEHLNKLLHVARAIGSEPKITNPIIKESLRNLPFRAKIIHAWFDEIKPSIAHQSAQHIGKELAKACLIALGAAEDVRPIQTDWEKILHDRVESLNTDEIEVQKFLFLIKYSELKSTSVKQDDFFNTTYEQLIDSGQGATR